MDVGLLELDRRNAAGDRSAYGQFYTQGATFWATLDAAISGASNGARSLDDYVMMILRTENPKDAPLPKAFVHEMRKVLGGQFDALFSKYVGT